MGAVVCLYGWGWRIETCHASGIAARIIAWIMMMFGALRLWCHIIFHTYHAIGMMMMWNNGYDQHDHADKKEKREYVPFIPHSYFYIERQR